MESSSLLAEDPGAGVDWLAEFNRNVRDGRPVTTYEQLDVLRKFAASGRMLTTEPILPALFNLKGKPYTLRDHFPFGPLFRTRIPKKTTVKAARQVSKSTSLASEGLAFAASVPHSTQLFVTPLFEQIRRFSTNYVGEFVDQSPLKALWVNSSSNKSVLQRSFVNNAKMIFSFAFLDANRTRGINADRFNADEIQNMPIDLFEIIEETMSHSEWMISRYAGTPLSMDGTLQVFWDESSQAEWIIPCTHCTENGRPTENIPTIDYHLFEMIGPYREDISEENPATICHKCRQIIYPRTGRWRHRYPEKRWSHAGYHIPQVIMPLHYGDKEKWATLLVKQDSMAPNVLANEVLGESSDSGSKLVSQTEIRAAAILPWKNPKRFDLDQVDPEVMRRLAGFSELSLGIDWGGGRRVLGRPSTSFTKMALVGLRATGQLELVWGAKLNTPHDHEREAFQTLAAHRKFRPHYIAHDFTGAGTLRETFMVQAGLPLANLMPIESARLLGHAPVVYVGPDQAVARPYWRMDKTRAILNTIFCLKRKILTTFEYDHVSKDQPGLLHDFLALFDEQSGASAGEIYTINRIPGKSDDFAQAVTLACVALWHSKDAWPDFTTELGYATLTPEQIEAFVGREGEAEGNIFGVP